MHREYMFAEGQKTRTEKKLRKTDKTSITIDVPRKTECQLGGQSKKTQRKIRMNKKTVECWKCQDRKHGDVPSA